MQEEVQEEPPTETQEEVVETINIPLMSLENAASFLSEIEIFLANPTEDDEFILNAIRSLKKTCEKILIEE